MLLLLRDDVSLFSFFFFLFSVRFFTLDFLNIFPGDYTHGTIAGGRAEDVARIDGAVSPRVLRVAGHSKPFSSNYKSHTIPLIFTEVTSSKKFGLFSFNGRKFFHVQWFFSLFFHFGFPLMTQSMDQSVQCFELFHCTVRARSPESMSPRPRSLSPCISLQISIGPLLRCADNRLIDWFCSPNFIHS